MNPGATARIAGGAYLAIMLLAPFAQVFVRGQTIVRGDPAATAANILAAQDLWLYAFVAELFTAAADITVAVLLYVLLRPAGQAVALLASTFQLVMVAIGGVKALFHLAPLILLDQNSPFESFSPQQLADLAFLSIRLHGEAYDVMLFLFGVHCLLVGWLIARTTFLPRAFGWLMAIAGVGYIANTLLGALAPEMARALYPWLLLPALPAEGGLALWLIFKGINVERWSAQATEARA